MLESVNLASQHTGKTAPHPSPQPFCLRPGPLPSSDLDGAPDGLLESAANPPHLRVCVDGALALCPLSDLTLVRASQM